MISTAARRTVLSNLDSTVSTTPSTCRRRTPENCVRRWTPYLTVATRVGRSSGGEGRAARRTAPPVSGRSSRDQNQAIREWANKNGYEVSERGRIPSSIVEAYHNKR